MRFFVFGFFHHTAPYGPLINQLKCFLIWLRIRRDIHNFKNSPLYNTAVSRDSPLYYTAASHDSALYYTAASQIALLFNIVASQVNDFYLKSPCCII
jgi:hypothetical protein